MSSGSLMFARARFERTVLRFLADTRGSHTEKLALIAGIAAVACVASAHMIDIAAKNGALPQIAFVRSNDDLARIAKNMPQAGVSNRQIGAGVDYTATASIPSQIHAILLDPCTGKPK